ncbi:uncharacterized protein DUF1987 [Roseibium hamelinense]|uniref:Uncharacterized protein DUF1987 n=1 Tax=Roseibium hamelinense TaxID=150831 RepID=A0A562TG99_9HYPH|nr:DUF1987 domain-containing protein [Roseibium hamelinense]MTI42402.1 DUF1987 domain-containing protein [Roseibium hamelinense]TWI92607.1 uncharacterized protein DUF1987 [Roseibium hamelinense]
MENTALNIDQTPRSPKVSFDPATGTLEVSGESYPEDASLFYGPILKTLKGWLSDEDGPSVTVDIRLIYFNSSSAKAIMNMFQMLEEAAEDGRSVTVNWHYDADDDAMEEMGEDFSEDFESATFNLKPDLTA